MLLGLVFVCPVEPAGGGDGGWRPLMVVRGSWGARTAIGGGIGCRQVAVSADLGLGGLSRSRARRWSCWTG